MHFNKNILNKYISKKCDIYLRGAYGPSNFGDDILMIITSNILRRKHPSRKISIAVEHPDIAETFHPGFDYISLDEPVTANLAVLGGGGQFFTFKSSNPQKTRKIRRPTKALIKKALFAIINGKYIRFLAKNIHGLCLGIGPFEEKESVRFLQCAHNVRKIDYISVRDATSARNVIEICGKEAAIYTDPAFILDFWLDDKYQFIRSKQSTCSPDKKIAFIIRGWHHQPQKNDRTKAIINFLIEKFDKNLTLISLDQKDDQSIINDYGHANWLIWKPSEMSTNQFMHELSSFYVAFTLRAHGAIAFAAMAIPTIIFELEPKLSKIHNMLPHITKICDFNVTPVEINEIYSSTVQSYESIVSLAKNDFNQQLKLSHKFMCDYEKI